MYFHVLEELKDSKEFDENIITIIDRLLYVIYEKGYHNRFNPRVYKNFKTRFEDFEPLEQVWVEVLELLSKKGYLRTNFEINCSECDAPAGVYYKLSEIPLDSEKICENCGEDFTITNEDTYITYTFCDKLKPLKAEESKGSGGEFFPGDDEEAKDTKYTLDDYCLYPCKVFDRHVNEKREELQGCLNKLNSAKTKKEKGNVLEDLVEKLLPSPYLRLVDKKFQTLTEEIDLVYDIKKFPTTLFDSFSSTMAVECKNWEAKSPSKDVHTFIGKMDSIDADVGIFFSKKGMTLDALINIIRAFDRRRVYVLIFNYEDLDNVINKGKNLYSLLEEKYYLIKRTFKVSSKQIKKALKR